MLKTLTTLAEPNRLNIVEYLRYGPHSVGEIVDQLKLSQPQVSKHLHVLAQAGLVEVQPLAQRRIYKLRPEPFQEMESWLESFRQVWNDKLDNLEAFLQTLQQTDRQE